MWLDQGQLHKSCPKISEQPKAMTCMHDRISEHCRSISVRHLAAHAPRPERRAPHLARFQTFTRRNIKFLVSSTTFIPNGVGLRDLTVVADKARLAQRGLYEVDGLLLTISRTLADSHCPEEQSGGRSLKSFHNSPQLKAALYRSCNRSDMSPALSCIQVGGIITPEIYRRTECANRMPAL